MIELAALLASMPVMRTLSLVRKPGRTAWTKTDAKLRARRGLIVGRRGARFLRDNSQFHWLVFGASGSGKTSTVFVPSLLACHDRTAIVFDPKGELFRMTSAQRLRFGPVYRIDLSDPNLHGYNPLAWVRWGTVSEHNDCMQIVESLPRPRDEKDDHWSSKAEEILLAVLLHYGQQKASRSMAAMYDHIHDLEDTIETLAKSNRQFKSVAAMADKSPKEFASVLSTLRRLVKPWSNPIIREITSRCDFEPHDLVCETRPATVYITVPDRDSAVLAPVAGFLIQAILGACLEHEKEARGGKKRWPVLAMIDEFPRLGRLKFIMGAAAVARSYGWKFVFACQGRKQLQMTYGRDHDFEEICACVWETATNDPDSLRAASTLVGNPLERRGIVQADGRMTISESRHPGLDTGDFHALSQKHAVIHRVGCKPMLADKIVYWRPFRHPLQWLWFWLRQGAVEWV